MLTSRSRAIRGNVSHPDACIGEDKASRQSSPGDDDHNEDARRCKEASPHRRQSHGGCRLQLTKSALSRRLRCLTSRLRAGVSTLTVAAVIAACGGGTGTTEGNTTPVARAGSDRSAALGATVTLDGSASSDAAACEAASS